MLMYLHKFKSQKIRAVKKLIVFSIIIFFFSQCSKTNENYIKINRLEYLNKLEGFWLGQCIANWTGLITGNG